MSKIIAQLLGLSERKVDIVLELMGLHFMATKLLLAVLIIVVAAYLLWKAFHSINGISLLQGVAMPRVRPVLQFFFMLTAAVFTLGAGIIVILALP